MTDRKGGWSSTRFTDLTVVVLLVGVLIGAGVVSYSLITGLFKWLVRS